MNMAPKNKDSCLRGIRGATTCTGNSITEIETAVSELIQELTTRNTLEPEQIISVTFSVTADLDACFPASIARKLPEWDDVALLDCQQMHVQGDLEHCIRILLYAYLPIDHKVNHPYLGKAKILRPDRSKSR